MEELIERAKSFIKKAFLNTDKAHDYQHSLRVYQNAVTILDESDNNANREIVLLSALLHDVEDKKIFADSNLLDQWFLENPSIYESNIRTVISEVSFSKDVPASTVESMIVQDADMLDAIGAIGIARVFTYGGAIGRPIYSAIGQSSLGHFDEKLFRIKDRMNTSIGKIIANNRESYMRQFVSELLMEIGNIQ